jgi:hypothetical protein
MFIADIYRVCFIMKWTSDEHDVEFCKEVIAFKLFETKKRSAERAQVWEAIAKKLEKWNILNSRWSNVLSETD